MSATIDHGVNLCIKFAPAAAELMIGGLSASILLNFRQSPLRGWWCSLRAGGHERPTSPRARFSPDPRARQLGPSTLRGSCPTSRHTIMPDGASTPSATVRSTPQGRARPSPCDTGR